MLAREDGRLLLISKYALDGGCFDPDYIHIYWINSDLRIWLNGDFLNEAFSGEEQALIPAVTVTADENPRYNRAYVGEDASDQVFLLSAVEAQAYFNTDKDRVCIPTPYAATRGIRLSSSYSVDGQSTCWWWTRTATHDLVATVNTGGGLNLYGEAHTQTSGAIRPSIWLEVEP